MINIPNTNVRVIPTTDAEFIHDTIPIPAPNEIPAFAILCTVEKRPSSPNCSWNQSEIDEFKLACNNVSDLKVCCLRKVSIELITLFNKSIRVYM